MVVASIRCGENEKKMFCRLFEVRNPPVVVVPVAVLAKVNAFGTDGSAASTVTVPLNWPGCAPAMVTVCPVVTEHSPAHVTVAVWPLPTIEVTWLKKGSPCRYPGVTGGVELL